MDKKFKQQLGLIAFGVALFTALNNLNYISDFLHVCAELLTPVFAGLLMAFILSVPMRGIGKRLSRLMPKASERTINVLSLIITLLLLVAIIVLLCVIAIPQLIASVKSIISLIKEKWPDWAAVLRNYGFDTAEISAYLNKLDWKTIAEKAMKRDTGARALRSIIEDFMLDIMYEIPKDDNIGRVTITREYIEGTGGPIIDIRSNEILEPVENLKQIPVEEK